MAPGRDTWDHMAPGGGGHSTWGILMVLKGDTAPGGHIWHLQGGKCHPGGHVAYLYPGDTALRDMAHRGHTASSGHPGQVLLCTPMPRVTPVSPQDPHRSGGCCAMRGPAGAEPGLCRGALSSPVPAGGRQREPGGELDTGTLPAMVSEGIGVGWGRGDGDEDQDEGHHGSHPATHPCSHSTCTPEGIQCQDTPCDGECLPLHTGPSEGTRARPGPRSTSDLRVVQTPASGGPGDPGEPARTPAAVATACVSAGPSTRRVTGSATVPVLRHRAATLLPAQVMPACGGCWGRCWCQCCTLTLANVPRRGV